MTNEQTSGTTFGTGEHAAGDELQRTSLKRSLSRMGVALTPYAFEIAMARVTSAADRGGEIADGQIQAIVDDVISSTEILQGVAESFR